MPGRALDITGWALPAAGLTIGLAALGAGGQTLVAPPITADTASRSGDPYLAEITDRFDPALPAHLPQSPETPIDPFGLAPERAIHPVDLLAGPAPTGERSTPPRRGRGRFTQRPPSPPAPTHQPAGVPGPATFTLALGLAVFTAMRRPVHLRRRRRGGEHCGHRP